MARKEVTRYLLERNAFEHLLTGVHFLQIDESGPCEEPIPSQRYAELLDTLGLRKISTPEVIHRDVCHGCVLEHATKGWKIVYSGDTRPSENLITAGKDCDVLIHEATLATGLEADAAQKGHSTVGETIKVAEQMRARHLIMTHFSQRYSRFPPPVDYDHTSLETITCAFDLVTWTASDAWKSRHYMPILQTLLQTDEID